MTMLLRVFASFVYDLFILIALSVVLSAFFTLMLGTAFHETVTYRWGFDAVWLIMIAAYFVFSWRYAGQTIGMKAWKIRVVCHDGNTPLSWFEALGRLLASLANLIILNLGWLGYLGYWQQSLTDRLSKTAIERV